MKALFSISFPLGVFQEPGASWQAHAPVGGRPRGSEKEPWQGKVRSESQPHLSELRELGQFIHCLQPESEDNSVCLKRDMEKAMAPHSSTLA